MLRRPFLPAVAVLLLAACSADQKPEATVEPTAPKAALAPSDSASKSVSSSADMAAMLGTPQGTSVCRNYQRKLGTLVSAQASTQGAQNAQQMKAQVDALKAIIRDACS